MRNTVVTITCWGGVYNASAMGFLTGTTTKNTSAGLRDLPFSAACMCLNDYKSPLLESFIFEDTVLQEMVDYLILGEFFSSNHNMRLSYRDLC